MSLFLLSMDSLTLHLTTSLCISKCIQNSEYCMSSCCLMLFVDKDLVVFSKPEIEHWMYSSASDILVLCTVYNKSYCF